MPVVSRAQPQHGKNLLASNVQSWMHHIKTRRPSSQLDRRVTLTIVAKPAHERSLTSGPSGSLHAHRNKASCRMPSDRYDIALSWRTSFNDCSTCLRAISAASTCVQYILPDGTAPNNISSYLLSCITYGERYERIRNEAGHRLMCIS